MEQEMFSIREGVILEKVMNQYLVCDLERGLFGDLNEFGAELWGLLENPIDIGLMVQKMMTIFELNPTEAKIDIAKFLSELKEKGFIISDKVNNK